MRLLSLLSIYLILLLPALSAELEVAARFNPPRVAMGDPAQYIIEITESGSGQLNIEPIDSLNIPRPEGLTLRNLRNSNSQQTRIINGSVERSLTQNLIIDAAPSQVGRFTIPPYAIDYKGERLQVPAATLEVAERSADAGPSREEQLFLQAELPETLYLGQTIAFDLKLYVLEDVRLTGLNAFDRNADGFTLSELPDNPRESVERVAGRRYRVFSWPLKLTPIRTGEQAISFQFGLTARLPEQNRSNRDPFGRSPFGGSLFEDFFGRTERLNVFTEEGLSIQVLPLPEAGQPESFSGAIGDFAIEVGADTDQATQGEPIMLSLTLKGKGNFERINGPRFPESEDWRHYEPESKFEPGDDFGLDGSQRFDYVFIPRRPGQLKLPETRFSYFDPEKKEYVELSAPPIPIEVAPAANQPAPGPSVAIPKSPDGELQLSKSLSSEEALLTLDYRPKPARTVGYAILRHPGFISLNLLAGLLLLGSVVALERNKRQRLDPTYRLRSAAKQALEASKAAYLQALQQDDAEAFYKHGQLAIRQACTIRTGRSMQSADSAEIAAELSDQAAEDCRAFFEAADARRFGGRCPLPLPEARLKLENILKAL